jgi:hypothetical protein
VKTNEQKTGDLAMSWENVRAIFPYGLPASLQCGDQRPSCDSNVINFEQWCRRHREGIAAARRSQPHLR